MEKIYIFFLKNETPEFILIPDVGAKVDSETETDILDGNTVYVVYIKLKQKHPKIRRVIMHVTPRFFMSGAKWNN